MSLYLLHLEPSYKHARHYLGYAEGTDVTRRVNEHLACGAKASPLIKAALQAGSRVIIARTWTDETATRTRERQLKNTRSVPDYCPLCRARWRKAANQQEATLL